MRAFLDTSPVIIILKGIEKYNDENWKKKQSEQSHKRLQVEWFIEFSLGKRIPVKTRV